MGITKETFNRIVEKLVELKDTSELMIDLAYTSILLNSKELAEEVQKLEEHIDDLHTEFEFLVLSSGFSKKEAKEFLGLIRLGIVIENISDAAAEIAEVVIRGLEPHPILSLVIKEAQETVTRAHISPNSSLVGKTLREARIPEETGMWILVIKRGNRWIRPNPNVVIQTEDMVIASGYTEGEEDFLKLVRGEK
jgi:uncharacterized protein with PhoU and TrkA domain